MYNKFSKLWILYFCITFLVLCSCMSVSSLVYAFAEEGIFDRIQGVEIQVGDVNLTTETRSSGNKAEYLNLGSARLLEGSQGVTQIHYIENANYFLANPLHRENYDTSGDHLLGTCTTVAHQLLVGYHNYYSDRRLIPETSSDGNRYLSENYGDLNLDPVLVYNASLNNLGRDNIGTTDEVFYGIFDNTGGSYNLLGQTIGSVADATDEFLENCLNGGVKNWTIENSNYSKQEVVAELDAGRPVIIGFDFFEGHTAHVVVAYGYANHNGNFCYITHYGWGRTEVQMLVPESWLGYQVTMTVDHTHAYELVIGETYTMGSGSIVYHAMECEVCGGTTLVDRATLFAGGTGYLNDPYLISNAEQFNNIRYAYRTVYVPREGNVNQINYAFKLKNNITLSGDWHPFTYQFTGDFDGDGHYISYSMNLSQADINESLYQGLFGFVAGSGKIYDLELMNCSITSATDSAMSVNNSFVNIGILAGAFYESGGITNIIVTNPQIECRISNACIGALAGSLHLTSVTNCVVRQLGDVEASITNNAHGYLGGMAGMGDIGGFSGGSITITLTNEEFDEDSDMMGKVAGNSGDTVPNSMTANVTMNKGGCVVAGTLITLADGSQKAVEDLTGDEMLLVWNLKTGSLDEAPILFIDNDPIVMCSVINLYFSDGTQVKVISEHGFWDYNLNEYVYLDKEAAQYVGHWFNKLSTDESGNGIS